MRQRIRRNHDVTQRSRRLGWLAAGGAGTSVVDACHDELTLIVSRRGGPSEKTSY